MSEIVRGPKSPPAPALGIEGCIPYAELVTRLERGYDRVEEWSSRTSRFVRYQSRDPLRHDLVVKTCDRWGPSEVHASVDHARAWRSLGAGGRASVLSFLAWSPEPATLVSEYVAGEELRGRLTNAGEASSQDITLLFRSIGALLGAIHERDPAEVGAGITERASRRHVWGAGDFAVYNFRLRASGEAVFLEPPAAKQIVSRFRDLSWFLASLSRALGDRRSLSRQLSRDFLDGYRGALRSHSWSAADRLSLLLALRQREALETLRGWRRHWRSRMSKR